MEARLEDISKKTKSKMLRIIFAILILFLTLAGIVALVSDLGFGDEVKKYRVFIWISLFVFSIIIVLGYEFVQVLRQNLSYAKQVKGLEDDLTEAQKRDV